MEPVEPVEPVEPEEPDESEQAGKQEDSGDGVDDRDPPVSKEAVAREEEKEERVEDVGMLGKCDGSACECGELLDTIKVGDPHNTVLRIWTHDQRRAAKLGLDFNGDTTWPVYEGKALRSRRRRRDVGSLNEKLQAKRVHFGKGST